MEACDHFRRWRDDFDLLHDIGLNYLRYGPPIHRTFLGPGRYDWEFTDLTFVEMRRRDIIPIVDLCHFRVPDCIGNFHNEDIGRFFAAYAAAFADLYPWVQLYTPVHEMFTFAYFSANFGWCNRPKTDREKVE